MVYCVGSSMSADPAEVGGGEHLCSGSSPSAAVSPLGHDPSVSEGVLRLACPGCAVLRTGARHGALAPDVRRVRRRCAVARFRVFGFGMAISHRQMRRSGVRRVCGGCGCDMRRGAFSGCVEQWSQVFGDPTGDWCDDSVSAHLVTLSVAGCFPIGSVERVVVWPSHQSFAFEWC